MSTPVQYVTLQYIAIRRAQRHEQRRRRCKKDPPEVHPVNDRFCGVLDYSIYQITDKSSRVTINSPDASQNGPKD